MFSRPQEQKNRVSVVSLKIISNNYKLNTSIQPNIPLGERINDDDDDD